PPPRASRAHGARRAECTSRLLCKAGLPTCPRAAGAASLKLDIRNLHSALHLPRLEVVRCSALGFAVQFSLKFKFGGRHPAQLSNSANFVPVSLPLNSSDASALTIHHLDHGRVTTNAA